MPSIVLGEPRSRLKASLVCLELAIRKGAISGPEFISLLQEWLAENRERWVPVFEKDRRALSLDNSEALVSTIAREPSKELATKVFVLGLLNQTNTRDMTGTCGSLLGALLQKLKPETPELPVSTIWVAPVRHMMLHNPDTVEAISSHVLQPLFSADPSGFTSFVETLPLKSLLAGDMTDADEAEYMLLFAALRIGKKTNLVHEDYDGSKPSESKEGSPQKLVLKSEVLGKFLLHREPNIRVAALSLLVTAFSTIKPFTSAATNSILRGLPSMHADSDSYSRGEIMSLTRKLIVRLKSGILAVQESSEATAQTLKNGPSGLVKSDDETVAFLRKYINFLAHDLCVTASYPRHISALKALKLLLESNLDPRTSVPPPKSETETRWKFHMNIFEPRLLRLLVDLLLDPFEEVRQTSLLIINLFPSSLLMGSMEATSDQPPATGMRLTDALALAENIASNTSRADHADTVARLYHILFCAALSSNSPEAGSDWWSTKPSVVSTILSKLEERLSSSKGLFNSTLREAPLHGYMSGLRYIVSMPNFHALVSNGSDVAVWRSIHDRISSICERVWEEVKPVLCIDSPEGHTDDPIEDLTVGPKDILSYSWRALRESSLLLHATMVNTAYGPVGKDGLQREDFEKVGRASFTQLAELRHRGAFSTVSTTFATCCQRCSSSMDVSIQELPKSWYQEARATIFESASKLTRRSAGLPALVTGIFCSLHGTPFFKEAMDDLHEISRLPVEYNKDQQYLELPQVHAMNCLKDIFTNTKLGLFTEPFIMPALTLSAERLGSPIWALRNSGLMLFRALLTRMCRMVPGAVAGFGGVSGSEPGSKISFLKYPGLLELLSRLLAPSEGTTAQEGTDIVTERIFPALELIGEKIPAIGDDYDKKLCGLVLEHFKSPVWGIREHAARVYSSLLIRSHIPKDVEYLVNLVQGDVSENYVHGIALCVRYSLRRFASTTDVFWAAHLDGLLATLRHVLATLFSVAKSPSVATCLVEILNDTLERSIAAQVEDRITSFIDDIYDRHGLHGVLGDVFDASQAGWNLASSTRASSLLRRTLAWCTILKLLVSQTWPDIPAFYHGVSQFDADVGRWIVEQLPEHLMDETKYRKPLVDLYTSIVRADYPADAKTIAASNLATILEEMLASSSEAISEFDLPCDELEKGFKPESNFKQWNRHATDAELRLQGCLLAVRAGSNQGTSISPLKGLHRWVIKLRSALTEETEFTTRYAAVVSVHSFSTALRPADSSPRTDAALLDIYLVLYDMLNDDDEELRDIAASTASWVLSYSSVSPNTAVALGPLNASGLLARFIADHYSDSMHFARRVIQYLTGQEPRISGSDNQTSLVPVSELVAEHCQESIVLFVEEKQNLFVDDVREVDIWSEVLLHLRKNAYPETLVRQISSWVSEGLQHLLALASQDAGKDGLLGWTSKPESFVLGVRVISIASSLGSQYFALPEALDAKQDTLRKQLQALLEAGKKASLHDNWLSRMEAGLDSGVAMRNQV
ncbi:uncharacterized protein N7482_007904 [Penicillium canariense]|uniref:DUF2428 domain-containing protein n=1 Tax=Penicillium canariense TaxID=189055 RepID=A0A9W9I2L7_9EURO|nr:uncharacterized protein N7482_007904 [Penicillium canariense]KAJ5160900.1 hypothetical protein N7482_007904 [Penicillium canariense]